MSLSALGCGQPIDGVPYVPFSVGVHFDGSTYLTDTAIAAVAGSQGILSYWINTTDIGGNRFIFRLNTIPAFNCNYGSAGAGTIEIFMTDATGTSSFSIDTSTTMNSGSWINILASWDTNFSAGNKKMNLYFNDVAASFSKNDTSAAFNIGYADTSHSVGASNSGSLKITADIAELYYAPDQYLDFTIASNRRKFITAGARPVDLGATGTLPTGSQPQHYLSVRTGGVASDFLTNRGSGGNFSVAAGALTLSATNP